MLRLCSVQQREVKTYRWKPYVNKVSAVVITLLVAPFFPPLIDGPFPTLPSGLVRSSFIGEHISLLPSNSLIFTLKLFSKIVVAFAKTVSLVNVKISLI